jgi:thiazole synthase ThiGH ThiG subunit
VDGTVDFIAPQLELAPAASTPILPNTTGASTRGADVITATLASLGVSGL